ncbi:MAG: lysophospholipid acyltransferase family protein [Gemmatimonadaceae bacterium]|nr:lysophospholipid acyltransferase family protein [Gemmatimonadaceae bacterium]
MTTQSGDDESLRLRMSVLTGSAALRAIASTWRFRIRGGEHLASLRAAGTPFIFSLWHGQLLPLIWHHRGQHVAILVSEHRDGELIARIARSIGYRLIRGSTTRGGGRALLALVRTLEAGTEVAVTPDGPRGPAFEFAPGALVAAHRTGAPLLPVAAHADRAWRLSSWDGFIIPKPFARVTVAYGAPVRVDAESPRGAAAQSPEFEELMSDTVRAACAS